MARARNIKPGLFKNEVLGVADPLYTLLFEGLWVLADREGRLEDRPLRIKAEIFPYRDFNADAGLSWLEQNGFIRRYTASGRKCILILEFAKHQNPHKNESESELPAPESDEAGKTSEEIGMKPEIIGSTRADSLNSDSLYSDSLHLAPNGACPPAADEGPAKVYTVPDCPHAEILAIYHEVLPTLPAVEVMTDARRGYLRQRWREVCAAEKYDREQGLEWFRDYFLLVSQSEFLTGRGKPKPGSTPWRADFEWLIRPQNFAKVIEQRYNQMAAA